MPCMKAVRKATGHIVRTYSKKVIPFPILRTHLVSEQVVGRVRGKAVMHSKE